MRAAARRGAVAARPGVEAMRCLDPEGGPAHSCAQTHMCAKTAMYPASPSEHLVLGLARAHSFSGEHAHARASAKAVRWRTHQRTHARVRAVLDRCDKGDSTGAGGGEDGGGGDKEAKSLEAARAAAAERKKIRRERAKLQDQADEHTHSEALRKTRAGLPALYELFRNSDFGWRLSAVKTRVFREKCLEYKSESIPHMSWMHDLKGVGPTGQLDQIRPSPPPRIPGTPLPSKSAYEDWARSLASWTPKLSASDAAMLMKMPEGTMNSEDYTSGISILYRADIQTSDFGSVENDSKMRDVENGAARSAVGGKRAVTQTRKSPRRRASSITVAMEEEEHVQHEGVEDFGAKEARVAHLAEHSNRKESDSTDVRKAVFQMYMMALNDDQQRKCTLPTCFNANTRGRGKTFVVGGIGADKKCVYANHMEYTR